MHHFANLNVWKRSHAPVLNLYRLSAGFPIEEPFGLTSQIRRAAASVPTNMAEGSKRKSQRDYAHFLNLAEASLAETEYLILLSAWPQYPERAAPSESQQRNPARPFQP